TIQSVTVVTGSSSQSHVVPKLCMKATPGNVKELKADTSCTGGWTDVPGTGQTIVVPAYTAGNVTVVTSAKMAMDILPVGNYATTDGGPACSFSITGDGSTSTNLVQVQ